MGGDLGKCFPSQRGFLQSPGGSSRGHGLRTQHFPYAWDLPLYVNGGSPGFRVWLWSFTSAKLSLFFREQTPVLAGGGDSSHRCLTARVPPPGGRGGGGSQEPFRSRQEGGWRTRDRDALLDSARNTLEPGWWLWKCWCLVITSLNTEVK